ncbi:MAG: restriction endonuclease subunit S [Oscillospiraceae bacterium]|nr:restriction endonuclease subunit S [Oscillospiraceae bacterium]
MSKVRLGDLFSISSGGTPNKKNPEYYINGDIPWIKTGDLKGKYISNEIEYITEDGLINSSAKIFPRNTVLVAMYGATIGACSILPFDASTNQACAAFLPNDRVIPEYLYYFLCSKKEKFIQDGVGGAQPNISAGYLKKVEIEELSLNQQKQIAATLDQVTDLINKRKQQLEKLDELVKSRFIEMFGDPISNPMNLPVKTLKQLSVLITNGNTPKGGSENYVDKGILFIRSQNVWRNRIDLDDVAYIDDTTHHNMSKSSVHYKDILITKTGRINTENSSLGRAALYLGEDNSANINGHVYLVRLNASVIPEYVITILTSEAYRNYIRKVCVGGIDKRQINLDQVEEFPIILPSIELQTQFAAFDEATDKLKFEAKQGLEKLETLKKSLMQEYFG